MPPKPVLNRLQQRVQTPRRLGHVLRLAVMALAALVLAHVPGVRAQVLEVGERTQQAPPPKRMGASAVPHAVELDARQAPQVGRGALDVELQGLAQQQAGGIELAPPLGLGLDTNADPGAEQKADGGCGPGVSLKECGEQLKGFQTLALVLGVFVLGIVIPAGLGGLLQAPLWAWAVLAEALLRWRDVMGAKRARPIPTPTEETRDAA